MSRRFTVLVVAGLLVTGAGAALAAQPPSGPEPSDPLPASLCTDFPHPLLVCSAVVVSCPSSARTEFACKTTGITGPAGADIRRLALRLPRVYTRATLVCAANGEVSVRCKVVSRATSTAAGVRMDVVRLPTSFQSVRISCTDRSTLACAVRHVT
jgi:hypothetical protein